jgi:predicted transcriptional regulator
MAGRAEGLQRELARLRAAAGELAEALAVLDAASRQVEQRLVDGEGPLEAYRSVDFAAVHNALFESMDGVRRVYDATRGEAIRVLVEEEGRTLTEIARTVGRSRQFVTRLYHQAQAPRE